MKKKCIVVDLEGTLTDSRHRQGLLDNKDYDAWNERLHLDRPNEPLIDMLVSLQDDYDIFISTAKPTQYSTAVIDWLKANAPLLEINYILMRPKDVTSSSPDIKRLHIIKIQQDYHISLFIDDRKDVMEMVAQYDIPCFHLDQLNSMLINKIPEFINRKEGYPFTVSAADYLRDSADIYEERGKMYGSAYKDFGAILSSFFPNGIELKDEITMNRFAPLLLMMVKMQRYCNNFDKGGHSDSLIDLSTYSAMLNELDSEL